MLVTAELRAYAVKHFGCAADASDDVIRKAVSEALFATDGKFTAKMLADLTVVKATEAEVRVQSMIDATLTKAMGPVMEALGKLTPQQAAQAAAVPVPAEVKAVAVTPPAPVAPVAPTAPVPSGLKSYAIAGCVGADEPELVRVKSAAEQYSDNRTLATWDKSSNQLLQKQFGGAPITQNCMDLPYTLDMPTDRSKAISGAWMKNMTLKMLRKAGRSIEPHQELTEHDRALLLHAVHTCKFIGEIPGTNGLEVDGVKLMSDLHRKAVLDDSTSGGLEAVPIEFDAAVILTPLLNGEVFPYVSITNVTRRRIEATKISNVTMSWGTGSGTAIPLFDTDAFISAFDNSIYPLTGAIELGLDFLADSPLAVGNIVINLFGERFKQVMDDVIVVGNGTNQPEGLFTASGVTTISSANGTSGPPTMGDYEGLMFGVGKEYLQQAGMPPNSRAMFIGTHTSYKRSRGIKVNSTADERRLYGNTKMDYRLEDFRYAINGSSSFSNNKVGFFCMNRYRMYRRQGLEVIRVGDTDWNLARQNKQGIALRSRWGGALELATAGCKIIDMQS